jgi:uncharacterized protein (TIGR02996 family)
MNCQHDALYRAICANPDEDTPRLAYADLIEEEGDFSSDTSPGVGAARAAFIRTQIALARVQEYDPLAISTHQLNPDMFTGWGMLHTLPKLPAGYSWEMYEFRRGFPWKVGVRSLEAFVGDGATVFDAAPIQALKIEMGNRPDIATLADWPHLTRIRRLEFSQTHFGADAITRLGESLNATQLAELAFEFDGITAEGLESLNRSKIFAQLTALELRTSVIPPALIVDALAAAHEPAKLSRLCLKSNRIDRADAAHLFALPLMRNLQFLDLSDNPQLGVVGIQALAQSGILPGLRVLNLSKTRPGVPGIRDLVESAGTAGMRSLDLSANRLGTVAVKLLAESAAARGLQVLNLAGNPVQDSGAIALANTKSLSSLLELNLEDADLTDAGALALADSPYLNSLLRLNLKCYTKKRPFSDKIRRVLVEQFGQRVSC